MSELLQNGTIHKVAGSILERRRFLIATHIRPDGDALGSVLAMAFMLKKIGKHADPCCQDAAPPGFEFLAGAELLSQEAPAGADYDAAILVDCGELSRVGSLADSVRRIPFLINIDHHISKESFGQVSWVESTASSTCEMLYDLSLALGIPLDAQIATQLYTGLLTDTGSFRFSNTNKRVFEIATALTAAGADPAVIAEQVYDSASHRRLLLLARALGSAMFFADNRLATAELSQKMFAETSTTVADGEGFINHLRSVRTVEMAMVFKEEKDGRVNVSMRSKGKTDVATFARKYGGGGHMHAAAFRVPGSLDAVRTEYTKLALEHLGG